MTQVSRGRARLGALVPFTNSNLEPDLAMLCPSGVSVHIARMGGYDADEIPDAGQMQGLGEADLQEPLTLLAGVRPDMVMYGCTSATLTHGPRFDRDLADLIRTTYGIETITAAGALVHALNTLGARRIGFASPYVAQINESAVQFLAQSGIETVQRSDVTETLDNTGQGALSPEAVHELGRGADHAEADAVVLSCTDMRSVETLDRLEQTLGKPVISSNQAMMFQALQCLDIDDPVPGYGTLLQRRRIAAANTREEKADG